MSFNALQGYRPGKVPLQYHVFDLIWMDGHDLSGVPLTERKEGSVTGTALFFYPLRLTIAGHTGVESVLQPAG